MPSVFEKYAERAYPFRFAGELQIPWLVGGIPSDENTATGWIKTKLATSDDLIRQAVAEVMAERNVDAEEAAKVVADTKTLNGFKRDRELGQLYIEGRQLKAALKAAAVIAMSVKKLDRRWGETKKGVEGFVAEHIGVIEDKLYIANGDGPVKQPTDIQRRFVHTHRGSAIQYEEYVEDAHVRFTIEADHDFSEEEWAMIWLTAERQGIGASKSQGYGKFTIIKWEPINR
jgi:hypothetical protein